MAVLVTVSGLAGSGLAQDQTQVTIDRGLTDDLPYTAIYPKILKSVDDGNSQTVLTLQHPDAPLQCDAFIVAGAKGGWSADEALANLDTAGIEASWAPDFPGFKLVNKAVTAFSSGPALLFEGESDNSPLGVPIHVVHAEAVDGGRTYAVECIVERSQVEPARPIIDFIIANFSTHSDGQCCINPVDDRG